MNQYIKNYKLFSKNESVIIRDDMFIIGGLIVNQKTINAYCKKVKDQTGKDLKQLYSEQDIAEQLVSYTVSTYLDADKLPISALLGGEEGINEEPPIDQVEEPVENPTEQPAEDENNEPPIDDQSSTEEQPEDQIEKDEYEDPNDNNTGDIVDDKNEDNEEKLPL